MVEVVLKGVSKRFGDVVAADDVDLRAAESELYFLLGPSGCGKTTTLRLIAGFYKPDKGEIYFDNQMVNDVPPYRRNVGMVFQNYALWPHMTVYDNVVYGLKVRKVPMEERVERAKQGLQVVEMDGFATRYPNQLSGGQQQRVALARALVTEPQVLLLDEPLSNLDAKLRLETREQIKRIQKELKITTIYVTHDQSEALSMADQIAIMNRGRIEQVGTPRIIYENPANEFVAGFIGETNFISGTVGDKVSGEGFTVVETELGTSILSAQGRDPLAPGKGVVCSIRPEKVRVFSRTHHSPRGNVVEAKIVSLNYYGFVENYVVVTDIGKELKATNFDPGASKHRNGDLVRLVFDPGDVELFPLA